MDKNKERPEAYPKPSQSDNQFNNQNEFIEQQPIGFEDTSVSTVSTRENGAESPDAEHDSDRK